jgi:polyferredoxin
MGLPLLLLFNGLWPRVWCRHLCPAGAALEITAKLQFRRDDGQKPEAWLDV